MIFLQFSKAIRQFSTREKKLEMALSTSKEGITLNRLITRAVIQQKTLAFYSYSHDNCIAALTIILLTIFEFLQKTSSKILNYVNKPTARKSLQEFMNQLENITGNLIAITR